MLAAFLLACLQPEFPVEIKPGTKLPKGEFLVPAPGDERTVGAIVITGENATFDLSGILLRGTPADTEPNLRSGIGIEVRGRNITIKNARVKGYKIGLIARNVEGLKIINCDFSDNWKQRLKSTPEKEDETDWMSYHDNDGDEWRRYGAGIYLRACPKVEVRGTTILRGQNGLLMAQCDDGLVWNNNFSYLSSLGIGMYRSSRNRVMHNRLDYCLRGFSYGVYNRGQDSAAILIYEQSNNNVFAYNSATHSGDGFFLWAGKTTMDTGKGGCNDNLLYGNDFSHAPTNGIEATFSKNTFANNLLLECWHGVWGGYSYDSKIVGNLFGYNVEGIAIEHGQENLISGNTFFRDQTAIRLWMNEKQDPNWGYPKTRDTASRGYRIFDNVFSHISQLAGKENVGTAVRVKATSQVDFGLNTYGPLGRILDARGPLTNLNFAGATMSARKWTTLDGETIKIPETVVATPDSLAALGNGFSPELEGKIVISGYAAGVLPPASALTFTPEHPKDAYATRFETNWNPLKNRAGDKISLGIHEEGKDVFTVTKAVTSIAPLPRSGGVDPFLKPGTPRGWRTMIVDEWGPYDFKRPLLRVSPVQSPNSITLEKLGPEGEWKVHILQGLELDPNAPSNVLKLKRTGERPDRKIIVRYTGPETIDVKGNRIPAGTPIDLVWQEFRLTENWAVKFMPFDEKSQDPRSRPVDQTPIFEGLPVAASGTFTKLDFSGYGEFAPGVPRSHFGTTAETMIDIPAGEFEMVLTADDGARVLVDDVLVIKDGWKYQGPTEYRCRLSAGKRKIRIDHFQLTGYSALKVEFRPVNK